MSRSRSDDYDIVTDKQLLITGSYVAVRGQALISLKQKSPSNKITLEYKISKGSINIEKESSDHETANLQVITVIPTFLKEDK